MCICTRFTCAAELTALPNNSTKPSIAIEILRLIFSPDVVVNDPDINYVYLQTHFGPP